MDESVRFLVADDHPIYRQGVVAVIRSVPQYTVCAEACDAEEALEGLQREKPDVVLVDSFLAGENGLDLIRRIMDARPALRPSSSPSTTKRSTPTRRSKPPPADTS